MVAPKLTQIIFNSQPGNYHFWARIINTCTSYGGFDLKWFSGNIRLSSNIPNEIVGRKYCTFERKIKNFGITLPFMLIKFLKWSMKY